MHRDHEPPACATALAIAAHPDDLESWCVGTLLRMIGRGTRVTYLICTRGDKGSSDPAATSESVARTREREQREAARRVGVECVEFLEFEDGFLEDTPELRERIVREVRSVKPGVVFAHDPVHPYPEYTAHRDHRVAGRAALDAVYPLARDRLCFPEHAALGLGPHVVREAWLFCTTAPNRWVDISETFERKVDARLAHASQTSDPEALRSAWRQRAESTGREAGITLAESFKVIRLES